MLFPTYCLDSMINVLIIIIIICCCRENWKIDVIRWDHFFNNRDNKKESLFVLQILKNSFPQKVKSFPQKVNVFLAIKINFLGRSNPWIFISSLGQMKEKLFPWKVKLFFSPKNLFPPKVKCFFIWPSGEKKSSEGQIWPSETRPLYELKVGQFEPQVGLFEPQFGPNGPKVGPKLAHSSPKLAHLSPKLAH